MSFDPRVVRVLIEVEGEFRAYEGLDIRVRVEKSANPQQNSCEVVISNLTKETRNYLLTETTPFTQTGEPKKAKRGSAKKAKTEKLAATSRGGKRAKRMIIEAGRVSTGVTRIFYGDIIAATPSQPPDISLTLKAQTGTYAKGLVLAKSAPAQQSLRKIAEQVAADVGVALDFQAADKQIANYAFNGAALRQVDALQAAGGVDAYVDDETLVVKDRGKPLAGRVRDLSAKTGMIGIPEVTERGIKVTMLMDRDTILGGAVKVKSELNPAVDGQYTIYKLGYELTSRDGPFYIVAECKR